MNQLQRSARKVLFGPALLLHVIVFSQCPAGNVTITSQSDVDAFAASFPNCDTLPGDLVFTGIYIDDLSAFANVSVIQGDLRYSSTFPGPYDFTGFGSLTHVGGSVEVFNCQRWRSFAGLGNLQRVEGSVLAQYVDSIEGLSGLSALDYVGGDLEVWGGPLMTGLAGLNELDTVMGKFEVWMGNASGALPNQLEYVGGDFRVTSGTGQLTGGAQLTRIDGQLMLGTPNMPSASAFPVLGVVHDLYIGLSGISSVNLNILPALDSVLNNMEVGATSTLSTFSGLNNIDHVGGWLRFSNCDGLVSIANAFQSVDSCGWLWLEGNDVLTDISAFDRSMGIGTLQLTNNPLLSYCQVQAICERVVPNLAPLPAIDGNATGCASGMEVYDLCVLSTQVADVHTTHHTVFPNPAQDQLRIEGLSGTYTALLYTPDGRLAHRSRIDGGLLNIQQLKAGVYTLRVEEEPARVPVNFVKQ